MDTIAAIKVMFAPRGIRRLIVGARSRFASDGLRSGAVMVVGLAAAGGILVFVETLQPLRTWLSVPVGIILGWQVLLNAAWAAIGLTGSYRLFPSPLPALERLCAGVALGVVVFTMGLYGLGTTHLFRPMAAVALLLACLVLGAPGLQRWLRELGDSPPEVGRAVSGRALAALAAGFGVLGLGLIYLGVFTPDAVNYDSRWLHMGIAESYAREGWLVPFPGDWVRCYPHLASMLHTWDFLVPGLNTPALRWMMGLHTEFSLFVWTLVGLAATVSWLASSARVRGAWGVMFLFPGIFLYDNNLGGAADHIVASFVLPLFLLSVRLPTQGTSRAFVLWGAMAGGAFLTKYQAVYIIAPAGLLMSWLIYRHRSQAELQGRNLGRVAAYTAGAFLVVTAPHFLKNIVFHGNPFYPLAQEWFGGSHPTMRDGPLFVKYLLTDWHVKAPAAIGPRLTEAIPLLGSFSFKPHYSFWGERPTFGFLFTLALPLLLLVKDGRRLWMGALVSAAAVFCWAFTYRVDRNLQMVLPILAATTAAIFVRCWHLGLLARAGIVAMVLAQLVSSGDLMFGGWDRITASMNIIRSGSTGRAVARMNGTLQEYLELDRLLPKDAVLLLHHWHPQLGINRRIYLDWAGFQGEVDYRNFNNARDFYDRLRTLGITHVLYLPGEQAGSFKQEDVIFNTLAINHGGPKTRVGVFEFYALPDPPPRPTPPLQVLMLGLVPYADGLYPVSALGTCRFLPWELMQYPPPSQPISAQGAGSLVDKSDAVMVLPGYSLDPEISQKLARDFQAAAPYPGLAVHIRRSVP